MPEHWEILHQWLPANLDERARACGFFQRARGLQDNECWLRLILMHVAGGLSSQQTAARARVLGLAQVSGVALFKRLKTPSASGHVPKSNDASAKAWKQAKILTSLLIERVMIEGRFFPLGIWRMSRRRAGRFL